MMSALSILIRSARAFLADFQDWLSTKLRDIVLPNGKLVFVVDDDPGTLRGLKRVLRQHGYESLLFPTAEAFENHSDFENALCVIIDINLNDRSGIELGHGLKNNGVSVPVIYMTGDDNPAVRAAALQCGCLAYLTKPFSANSLIESLERAWAGVT
jgi:FixJ family two-component response regulator